MSKKFNYNKQYSRKPENNYEPVVLEQKEPEPEVECETCKVTLDDDFYEVCSNAPLNFRAFAKKDAEVRMVLEPGTTLTMIQDLGEWCEVKYESAVGFVMKEFIKKV